MTASSAGSYRFEWPKLPALDRVGQRERIPTEQVDMVKTQGREAGEIFWLNGEIFSSKLLQGCIDIWGVLKSSTSSK